MRIRKRHIIVISTPFYILAVYAVWQASRPPVLEIKLQEQVSRTKQRLLTEKTYVCPLFQGGLGNQIWQYASAYGIAMKTNKTVIICGEQEVNTLFHLRATVIENRDACQYMVPKREAWPCSFDPGLLRLDTGLNYTLSEYLQSWKYIRDVSDDLRTQLTFRDRIQKDADTILENVALLYSKLGRRKLTFIGVHVRRGDKLADMFSSYGYMVPGVAYIRKAVFYILKMFRNAVFVVCSDDVDWVQTIFHEFQDLRVEFMKGSSKEVDLAVLASCNHTIMTVGTFGWWAGWLAGGTVVYYKWPALEGSYLWTDFGNGTYLSYYYPHWIGIGD